MELVLPPSILTQHARLHRYCQGCLKTDVKLYTCNSCMIGVFCSEACHIGAREGAKKRAKVERETELQDLPNELLLNILRFLNVGDLKNVRVVSQLLDIPGGKALLEQSYVRLTDQSLFKLPEFRRLTPFLKKLSYEIDYPNWWSEFPNLTTISFQRGFNQIIRDLPTSVRYIFIRNPDYNQPLDFLPSNLTTLHLHANVSIDNLPDSIQYLSLLNRFNQPIVKLPRQLYRLKIESERFDSIIQLDDNYPRLTYVIINASRLNTPFLLPLPVQDLQFTSNLYDQDLNLSRYTELMYLGLDLPLLDENVTFELPPNILSLKLYNMNLNLVGNLPARLKVLIVAGDFSGILDVQLPRNLKLEIHHYTDE